MPVAIIDQDLIVHLMLSVPALVLLVGLVVTRGGHHNHSRLAIFVIYVPALFSFLCLGLVWTMYGPGMPWIQSSIDNNNNSNSCDLRYDELHELLEVRGIIGDAAVGLLVHMVILLSQETGRVAVAAKLFYTGYLVQLMWISQRGIERLATQHPEEGQRMDVSIVRENEKIVLAIAAMNGVGAYLLSKSTIGKGENESGAKEKDQ